MTPETPRDLEDRTMGITQSELQKEKQLFFLKIESSLRNLWNYINCPNIGMFGLPEAEEREKNVEIVLNEIMAKTQQS